MAICWTVSYTHLAGKRKEEKSPLLDCLRKEDVSERKEFTVHKRVCGNCADVCPNRANVLIEVPEDVYKRQLSYTVSVYRALLDLCGTVVLHWCGVDLQKEKRKQKRMSILSVVLPAYNEEQMVGKTCRVLHEVLSGAGISYELVLVNDGSKDNTWNERCV